MGIDRTIKQICLTAVLAALGTTTAFAADMGQASGTNVNVRADASASAGILGKIDSGAEFAVLDKVGDWFQISYQGADAFVSADYFEVTKADATIDGSGVNVREKATTASDSLGKYSNGDAVTVTGQNDGWYQISYQGGTAYVSKDYVTGAYLKDVPEIANEAVQTMQTAQPAAATYGIVTANSGLKLREEASTSAAVLAVLPCGAEVDVDRVGTEWIKVSTDDGQVGYVSAEYLSTRTGEKTTRSANTSKGAAVVSYGKQFVGTPYVWGGTNLKSGVDCSGFVYAVYRDFGITLNRSSETMASNGVAVSKSDLAAGDLVFFNTGGDSAISHVGIYCGDGTYVHSTDGKGNGVVVTDLNSGYSANTYATARRVLK